MPCRQTEASADSGSDSIAGQSGSAVDDINPALPIIGSRP